MFARTLFAWRNLTHRKVRSLAALAGISFSVLLIFMQSGFYFAVLESATAVYQAMDGDIFLTSPLYVYLGRTGVIPRERLYQARGMPGVQDAIAFYADTQLWRNPQTRLRHPILVMGFDPKRHLLSTPANTDELLKDGQILVDSLTRAQFGPLAAGVTTEIGERQVRIAGHYRIGPGFATDGAAIMSDDTFVRTFRERSIEQLSVGVLRLENGTDAEKVAVELRQTLPPDTEVFTRAGMIRREQDYWIHQTSIGPVFASGSVLGLIIGVVVMYQVLWTDIANRLREYAALKALGYDSKRLRSIVLDEVSMFSVLGFAAGGLLSAGLYKIVEDRTGLPMSMHATRTAGIFLLTLGMCWIAGLLATRKLRHADPADLC